MGNCVSIDSKPTSSSPKPPPKKAVADEEKLDRANIDNVDDDSGGRGKKRGKGKKSSKSDKTKDDGGREEKDNGGEEKDNDGREEKMHWDKVATTKEFTNLAGQDFAELKEFTFNRKRLIAKIIRVKDGDTASGVFYYNGYGGDPIMRSIRFSGIDAPEMKGSRGSPHTELEKKAARVVKERLEKFIKENSISNSNIVYVIFDKEEKYGRLMGRLYLPSSKSGSGDDVCINDWLVHQKYAKRYNGGKKQEWTREELEYILLH